MPLRRLQHTLERFFVLNFFFLASRFLCFYFLGWFVTLLLYDISIYLNVFHNAQAQKRSQNNKCWHLFMDSFFFSSLRTPLSYLMCTILSNYCTLSFSILTLFCYFLAYLINCFLLLRPNDEVVSRKTKVKNKLDTTDRLCNIG